MNFFIKQNSNLPILKFPITQKIMEDYNITDDMMMNVAVTFSMFDEEEQQYIIANKKGDISYREDVYSTPYEEKYTLYYVFDVIDIFKKGRFSGEFKLNFIGDYCGTFTFPNNDYINIFISESITKTDIIKQEDVVKNKIWYGIFGDTTPTNGYDIRNLIYTYSNEFTLNTGTEKTVFVVAIPDNRNLVSIIDQDALNIDLTSYYELSQTVTSVPNDIGQNVPYKVYVYEIDTSYLNNHRHLITIN